jgi:hypothetical protein
MKSRFIASLSFLLTVSTCAGKGPPPPSEIPAPPPPAPAAAASEASEAPVSTPYGGKAHAIPGVIEAEHYDEGPPGVAYHDFDEKNHGVDYRGPTHVDIEARPDASNGHGIGWTKAGEWLVYTVDVAEAGVYRIEMPVAIKGKGGTFHLEFDGVDKTGPIEVPDTGGFDKLKVISKEDVRLEAGVQKMRLMMDSVGVSKNVMDIDLFRFVRAP